MKRNILVVEDDKSMLENITTLLEENGYEYLKATNGLEAIEVVEKESVDLIISDVMMPKLDGYGLYEELQKNPTTQKIPFILLTACVDRNSLRKGMNLGVEDYITKPFNASDLLQAIEVRISKVDKYKMEIDQLRENIIKYVPHELRTPLVSILGYSDFLYKEYSDLEGKEVLEMISNINKSGARLFERLEKFLVLAELEVNENDQQALKSLRNKFYSIDEQQIVRSLIHTPEINERLLDIDISLQNANVRLAENYFLLILKEIISNSCKFSQKNTPIILKGQVRNANYIIRVFDNGRGMSKEEIKELDAFRQFSREKYQQIGNGLGLYLVKKLTDVSGSEIRLTGSSRGTFVRISIPLYMNNYKTE